MIHVVSGVAFRDGAVLMGKRKPSTLRPSLWELPGGKVEPGEKPDDALCREWREELGVELAAIGERISSSVIHLEQVIQVDLHPIIIVGEPQCIDHSELEWANPLHAVQRLPCSPGFYLHFSDLRAFMIKKGMWTE